MHAHAVKSEVHSRVYSGFEKTNTTNCIVVTSDTIVDGGGYRATSGCTL
jgi:hypothetical protein